jgi:hypothetical protein
MTLQKLSLPSLTLCLSQPSAPVQKGCSLLLLMGCLQACLIPATETGAFIRLHSLREVGGWEGGTIPMFVHNSGPHEPGSGQYSSYEVEQFYLEPL